ncbi:MAG: hypothetical protein WCA46_26140 [Actinocatenispora sp.]
MESDGKTNWTAIGSVATVVATVIAFAAYWEQTHPDPVPTPSTTPQQTASYFVPVQPADGSPSPEPASTVALSDLPSPCDVPGSAVTRQFALDKVFDDDSHDTYKTCDWSATPAGWDESDVIALALSVDPYSASSDWTSVSVSGASEAQEHRYPSGGCAVEWSTTYGYVIVDAAETSSAHDSCDLAESFADAVLPDTPE